MNCFFKEEFIKTPQFYPNHCPWAQCLFCSPQGLLQFLCKLPESGMHCNSLTGYQVVLLNFFVQELVKPIVDTEGYVEMKLLKASFS